MLDMNSTTRTPSARGSSSAIRRANLNGPESSALPPGLDDSPGQCKMLTRRMWHRAALLSAALVCVSLVTHLPSADAEERKCVAWILQMEPGKIRIRGSDGTSARIDSSRLPTPLCVLEVVAERPRYKVYVADGELKGVWSIKRRRVAKVDGAVNVDCAATIVSAKVKIKDKRTGGVRAIGEEPCD